jgi:3-hydroxyacyl-[acyl-carrier-protein] dehydratase
LVVNSCELEKLVAGFIRNCKFTPKHFYLMIADKAELANLLPQKEPFVMVDCLFECNEKYVRTGFTPGVKNIFSDEGYFTEPGLIENMAQSAAAGTGYFYSIQNKPAPVGYIGAIKDFILSKLPQINDSLETEIKVVAEVMNATVVRATVYCRKEEIASCEMKIFLLAM